MMGHVNISTTMVYAQITEQKISDDMDKLTVLPNVYGLEMMSLLLSRFSRIKRKYSGIG